MISLSTDVLTKERGDTVERHKEYARRIQHLHMLAYAPRQLGWRPVSLTENLTVYPSRSISRYTFIWDAYRLGAAVCRSQRIDLIQTEDPFTTGFAGVCLKSRFDIALQVNNHSSFFGNRYWLKQRPLVHRVLLSVGRRVVRRADMLRVINSDQLDRYIKMGVDARRIALVRPVVHLERFLRPADPGRVAALRKELGLPKEGAVVLWVGRPAAPEKRLSDLLRALALLRRLRPDTYLVLAGDMRGAGYVERMARALNLEGAVVRAGSVAHIDLPVYYALSDVVALSSHFEGMGKVLLEAGASGKPVVATRIPGVVDVVRDGSNGLLCEVENPKDMAAKLEALLSEPERGAEMGRRGRELARTHFDRERAIEAVVALWKRGAEMGSSRGRR